MIDAQVLWENTLLLLVTPMLGPQLLLCTSPAFYMHVHPQHYSVRQLSTTMTVRRIHRVEDFSAAEDVVSTIMDAFRPQEKDEAGWQFSTTFQESAGSLYWGCLVLRQFSDPRKEKLDDLGRLQPGAFSTASALEEFLLSALQYRTLALLSEWKPVTPAKVLGMKASQQLLVRRELDQSGNVLAPANWEEVQINLIARNTPLASRWFVASLYKDYHGPGAGAASDYDLEDLRDAEDIRDC